MFLDDGKGLFWVLEEEAEVQQDDLLTLSGCDPDAGCEGIRDLLDLGDGLVGVVIGGPEVTSVRWIYKGVQFDVLGPSASLSLAEVRDIAQAIAKEAQAVG